MAIDRDAQAQTKHRTRCALGFFGGTFVAVVIIKRYVIRTLAGAGRSAAVYDGVPHPHPLLYNKFPSISCAKLCCSFFLLLLLSSFLFYYSLLSFTSGCANDVMKQYLSYTLISFWSVLYTSLIRLEPNPFPIEQSDYVVVAAVAAPAVRPYVSFLGSLPRIGE